MCLLSEFFFHIVARCREWRLPRANREAKGLFFSQFCPQAARPPGQHSGGGGASFARAGVGAAAFAEVFPVSRRRLAGSSSGTSWTPAMRSISLGSRHTLLSCPSRILCVERAITFIVTIFMIIINCTIISTITISVINLS